MRYYFSDNRYSRFYHQLSRFLDNFFVLKSQILIVVVWSVHILTFILLLRQVYAVLKQQDHSIKSTCRITANKHLLTLKLRISKLLLRLNMNSLEVRSQPRSKVLIAICFHGLIFCQDYLPLVHTLTCFRSSAKLMPKII